MSPLPSRAYILFQASLRSTGSLQQPFFVGKRDLSPGGHETPKDAEFWGQRMTQRGACEGVAEVRARPSSLARGQAGPTFPIPPPPRPFPTSKRPWIIYKRTRSACVAQERRCGLKSKSW
ncbi:unnamed protein product [Bursaphelenchus xylophilus]|uniref:(pine wood nematode) hypothetical protein n=1 Tax=Bursaphelenchus xylophilus TaxID=6326 RepID=A0A1I7RSB8_BURXY|nr:unnamed protein product [Bursaphelenchus xylophilus]CAG9123064.1 unnamed protein product [Bursaphelenchus xylophilus]